MRYGLSMFGLGPVTLRDQDGSHGDFLEDPEYAARRFREME